MSRSASRSGSRGRLGHTPEAHTEGHVRAATSGHVHPEPNAESQDEVVETPPPRPLKKEYEEITELSKVASLVMSTVYTSDHIDVSFGGKALLPTEKPKKRAAEVKKRSDEAAQAYAADYVGPVVGAQGGYPQKVVYRVHAEPKAEKNPKKDPEDNPVEPQGATVTEVFYDTAATIEHEGVLYAAFNYKTRTMGEADGMNTVNVPIHYDSFGEVSGRGRANVEHLLKTELAGHESIREVRFLKLDPTPTSAEESAKPHAEMQLLSHLASEGIDPRGLELGVSKPCCTGCAKVLEERGVKYPPFAYSPMKQNTDQKNWVHPDTIATALGFGFQVPHERQNPAQKKPIQGDNFECETEGHPVDPVTGANFDHFVDHEHPGPPPFRWIRHYRSTDAARQGPMGRGFRHSYEHHLAIDFARAVYTSDKGRSVELFLPLPGEPEIFGQGHGLRAEQRGERRAYVLRRSGGPTLELVEEHRGAPPRLSRLRDGDAQVDLTYDSRGRLSAMSESSPAGAFETRLLLDDAGHVVAVRRGPRGAADLPIIASYSYDDAGRLTRFTDALGAEGSYAYDEAGRMVRSTDRNGYSFHFRYDEQGRCVDARGDDGLWGVALRYEPEQRRTTATRANGAVWGYDYDVNGTILCVRDPEGGVRRRVTDDSGRVVRETGPGLRTLRFLYDETGAHTGVLDNLGYRHPPLDVAPNPPDPLTQVIPATPWEQQWGPSIESLTPTGMPSEGAPAGDVTPLLASARTPTQRDALGRVVEEADAGGHRSTLAYDPNGNVVGVVDRDGREHRSPITSWNQVAAVVDPAGNSTRYEHTTQGRIARIVDAGGSESRYEYDMKDRLVRVLRHGALREEYVYDKSDRLVEKRDRDGRVLLRCLNGEDGLPSERHLASGDVQRFERDARGEVIRAFAGGVEIRRERGARGRLCRDERDGVGIKRSFSAGGAVCRTTYLGRFTVEHRQEADGALVVEGPVGGPARIRRRERGRISVAFGNGTTVHSTYDHEGRCLSRELVRPHQGNAAPWSVRYSYSPEGELHRKEDLLGGVTEYSYDPAHRLLGESRGGASVSVALDRAGNVVEKPGLPRVELVEGNRLRAAGRERFRYDARHRLAERSTPGGEAVRYHYDSLDMLVRVTWPGRREEWTAAYDGLCRRVHKTMGGRRTDFYWDGDRLAAEVGPEGAVRIYVYPAPGALVPLLFIDYETVRADPASGRVFYPTFDQVGVPIRIEDHEGHVVWSAAHVEPYGALEVHPESTIACALRFPGHYWDEETGLHDNRHRSYSPRLARYLQSDPAGQSAGTNLYAYPPNPLVDVDVLGLMQNHQRGPGETSGGAAEKPGVFSRLFSKLRPGDHPATPPPMTEPARRRDEIDVEAHAEQQIRALCEMYPEIKVIWESLSVTRQDLLAQIKDYLRGDFVAYRGVQQCHPAFARGADTSLMEPKVPGSHDPPDFADNNNAWLPMGTNREVSTSIAVSWSSSIAAYFRGSGGMDASRPVALILQKRVVPPAEIAFCMDGEIQIKGPTSADETIRIMIDTDLGEIDEAYRGLTFRQWATASGVPIVNDVA